MNQTGNGPHYVYKDQETAEKAADHHRYERWSLIEKLRELNKSVDSLALERLINENAAELSRS